MSKQEVPKTPKAWYDGLNSLSFSFIHVLSSSFPFLPLPPRNSFFLPTNPFFLSTYHLSAHHLSIFFKKIINHFYFYRCTVTQSCLTLCSLMDCSAPGFPILHYLLEFAQIHVHWFGGAIQPFHSLSPPSPPALSLSQHRGLFQWVSSLNQVALFINLAAWLVGT